MHGPAVRIMVGLLGCIRDANMVVCNRELAADYSAIITINKKDSCIQHSNKWLNLGPLTYWYLFGFGGL
jgi:hypothetical protein